MGSESFFPFYVNECMFFEKYVCAYQEEMLSLYLNNCLV